MYRSTTGSSAADAVRRAQWRVNHVSSHATPPASVDADADAAPASVDAAPLVVVAGPGLCAETLDRSIVLSTTLGETLRTDETETVSQAWVAYTHALRGVRRVLLTAALGPAAVVRLVNVDAAEPACIILPPGARRYGGASYNAIAPGGAVTVRQLGAPQGAPHWGFVVAGGPTVPVVRRVAVPSPATVDAYRNEDRVGPATPHGGDFGDDVCIDRLLVHNPAGADPLPIVLYCADGRVVWERVLRGGAAAYEIELPEQ